MMEKKNGMMESWKIGIMEKMGKRGIME